MGTNLIADNIDNGTIKDVRDLEYEEAAVKNMLTGGTFVILAGLIGGIFGWLLGVFASRIIGPSGYAIFTITNSFVLVISSISGGLNQSISKYVAEGLVSSKEQAILYSKSGTLSTTIFGILLFSIFLVISFISYLYGQILYMYIYLFIAIALLFAYLRDNIYGNLAGFKKFNPIAIINLISIIISVGFGFITLLYIPEPFKDILYASQVFIFVVVQYLLSIFYGKRFLNYGIKSIYTLKGAKKYFKKITNYGLYCTIPQIILGGSIFWIQTIYYQFFLGPQSSYIGICGIIIGYSSVMTAVSLYGWPQIPAVSEAKAKNDQNLIDKLVSQCYKTGLNVSLMFLAFYNGLAHPILELFHGVAFLPGYFPFIMLSTTTTLIGLSFLISSMLIGVGEAKKAFLYISALIIGSFLFTPLFIFVFSIISGDSLVLMAGPLGLLVPVLIVLPFLFKNLPKFTSLPLKFYLSVLIKGYTSVAIANIISYIIENYYYPYNTFWNGIPTGFLIGALINMGIFMFLMCFTAALDEQDWNLLESYLGPLKIFIKIPRWISKHSPFYKNE